jgi:hypothetical protein
MLFSSFRLEFRVPRHLTTASCRLSFGRARVYHAGAGHNLAVSLFAFGSVTLLFTARLQFL